MMREIISGLWVGDIEACRCSRPMTAGKVAARIHACKHPCHADRCGQPAPSDASYLAFEEPGGADLFLNMIDPPVPLFQSAMFDSFLRYARDRWLESRPVLIHCNKGLSRAPILAMLFMAKILCVLPDEFDEAWDGFEKLCPLSPGKGIEDWMRANWSSIRRRPLNGGTVPAKTRHFDEYEPPDYSEATPEELVMLAQGCPIVHFATHVTIEDKSHNFITPVPNIYQMRANEAYELFQQRGIPARIMGLKPRQVGSSTFFGELCYHHSRRHKTNGMIIGDESSRTVKLWDIFTGYSDRDTFPWDSKVTYNTEKCTFTYADGSTGEWESDTANDPKAGIGGTRQAILYTEAARYSKTGARTDTKVITASLASLANTPESLAIMESTAEGAVGYFYRNWQTAATLADFRAGRYPKNWNGWVRVFAAWFEFREHVLPERPDTAHYFSEDLDDREKKGVQLYGWTMPQIAWRRQKIASECDGDARIFDQDYPEDDQGCFLSSGRPRFNQDGMTRLELMAKRGHDLAERGILEGEKLSLTFVPGREDSWLWVRERPKDGSRYICFVDPCSGEQSAGARRPDSTAAGILRAAELTETGAFRPAELVCCIDVPGGCRWDDSLLAKRVALMADWYGGCMVVPETGHGLGVLVKLREHGVNIYQREKMDAIVPGKLNKVAGWETNNGTRDLVVGAMADAIREQEKGFDCCYLPAVEEMQTFVIDDRGKARAKNGCHDDWPMGIGIGLATIRFASVYRSTSAFSPFATGVESATASAFS